MPHGSARALSLAGWLLVLSSCAWPGGSSKGSADGDAACRSTCVPVVPRMPGCGRRDLPQGDLAGDIAQEIPWTTFREPGVPGRPRTFAQIRIINLVNDGSVPLTLDRVCLISAPHRSPLELEAQRVSKGVHGVLFQHWHGSDRGVVPLRGYVLPPNRADLPDVPALDLLVGPKKEPSPYDCSSNAGLRIFYHTPDGQEFQRVYAVAVEFPNSRTMTSQKCDKTYNPWADFVATFGENQPRTRRSTAPGRGDRPSR